MFKRNIIFRLLRIVSISAIILTLLIIYIFPISMDFYIRKSLLNNPEIILEVINLLQDQENEEKERSQLAILEEIGDSLRNNSETPFIGNPNGDVTIIEFFDYKCVYCRQFYSQINSIIQNDNGIRIVFYDLPILGPESTLAARASIALSKLSPNNFIKFHSALMEMRGTLTETTIIQLAEEIGIDSDNLLLIMNDPEIDEIIQENIELALSIGINGTPGFIIGDKVIPGFIDVSEVLNLVKDTRENCKTC